MSSKNRKPQWHEPVQSIGEESEDIIEDSIEVGSVTLIDGPIDPVPLSTGPRTPGDLESPRPSAGPMPDLQALTGKTQDLVDSVKDKGQEMTQNVTEKAKDAVQKIADNASSVKTTAINAGSTSKSIVVSAAGRTGAGLWSVIQRSPLQTIFLISSLIWLVRNHRATASQPPVSVTDAAEKVGTISGHVQVAAGNLSSQVQAQAQQGAGWFSRTLQENPLVIGAMALVVGAGLGLAVPETSYEHKALGKTRDQLLDKAQEAAEDLGHKVQSVAQSAVHEAIESGKAEAKNQGLAPQG